MTLNNSDWNFTTSSGSGSNLTFPRSNFNHSDDILEPEDARDYWTNTIVTNREVPEPPEYLVISVTVSYLLIVFIGIFGNALVVLVVSCSKNMRTTVNMYMVNLCIADLLVLIVCMPPVLVELHVKEIWYFGEVMCKLVPFLELVVASASVFTIVAITIERFRAVYKPFSLTNYNVSYVIKSIVLVWIGGIILSTPVLFIVIYKDSTLLDGTPIKVCRMPARYNWQKSYFVLVSLLNYIIPVFVLGVLYFLLCKKLVSKTNFPLDAHYSNVRERRKLRKQVMHIIWTIVFVFFICNLPFRVVCFWWIFEDKIKIANLGLETNLLILYCSRMFLYLNHAINPILYNFVSTKFRHSCMILMLSPHKRNSSLRTRERRLPPSDRHKNDSLIQKIKHDSFKENVRLVKPDDDEYRSTSSGNGREKLNDFSPLYTKHIDGKDTSSGCDQLVDVGYCKFHITSPTKTPRQDGKFDTYKTDLTKVKLIIDSEGYVIAVKHDNTKSKSNQL